MITTFAVTLVTITMHIVSYMAAATVMHLYGASIPEDHQAALKHLMASAVLYTYQMPRKLAEAYVLMPKRHWEWVLQEGIDACVSLGQRPGLALLLVAVAVLGAVLRYWVLVPVVQWEMDTATATGTQDTAAVGRVCRVAVVRYLPSAVDWLLPVLVQLLVLMG
ncbi:hypothetical protein [Rothia mucilaginosa]|uniref:hypothetical protein n=1 Tax=Rothia mucilaginosa TaxID=43675 RepID=UPI00288BC255|nr:hypothetical protein [Rothia mucilaginosa]